MSTSQEFYDIVNSGEKVTESQLGALFDSLPPVSIDEVLGDWRGGTFPDAHPGGDALRAARWAGKRFSSSEEVYPVMITDEQGNRVWSEHFGLARLREVKFRGVTTAAMVYDQLPIIDYFHKVDGTVIMGAMDLREGSLPGMDASHGTFYFYLTRIEGHPKDGKL
ncbi:hypothetical protein BX666DRAFT_2022292 [Dichotomocladium elegans]|nr:hypothetical protein BX666DRAFT_2022292 [Dichotomocladium elegans]